VAAHDAAEVGFRVGRGQQEHFAGDELIAALAGFLVGRLQQLDQVTAGLHRLVAARPMAHLRQVAGGGVHGRGQRGGVGAGAVEQRLGAIGLLQHGRQHMGRLDVGVVARNGQALRVAQRLHEGRGEFVLSHVKEPPLPRHMGRAARISSDADRRAAA
jgi:hypothetical protein